MSPKVVNLKFRIWGSVYSVKTGIFKAQLTGILEKTTFNFLII